MKTKLDQLPLGSRVQSLKQVMFSEERFASVEQAKIVTEVYRAHADLPRNILRALALKEALEKIEIRITERRSERGESGQHLHRAGI